jgi:hypothetical protein
MAWPSNYVQVQVKGTFKDWLDEPLKGYVSFEPSQIIVDEFAQQIITPAIRGIELVDGFFQTYLLATDEPNVTPKNWYYNVTLSVKGGTTLKLYVPSSLAGSVLDISVPIMQELLDPQAVIPPDYATVGMVQGEQSARIAADALLIPKSEKGIPGGVATLDGSGILDLDQFPSGDFLGTDLLGQPNGVAELGSDGAVPPSQLPNVVFSQMTASSTWTINYDYGKRPDVVIYNNNDDVVVADVNHPDDSTVVVQFNYPETGKAILYW